MAVSYRKQLIYRKVCFGFCLCGFVLHLVAFLLPNWISYLIAEYRNYYGLFSTCIIKHGNQMCGTVDPEYVNGTFKAAQAFGSLALVTYFAAAVLLGMVFLWPRSWKINLLYSASGCATATCLFLMLTLVLFITSHPEHPSRLDFGYYIAISATVLSPLVGAFAFYIAKITSFPPKRASSSNGQQICVIDLESVLSEQDSRDMPFYLRETTEDTFLQIPPEFRMYTRDETKIGPSFFFNHKPSEEILRKVQLRNQQKAIGDASDHSRSVSTRESTISAGHLDLDVDSSRCTTPVEEPEITAM